MKINKLYLTNFRIHNNFLLEFIDNFNIIVGKNAVGKTSIVESIYMNALGKSHRTNNESELININNNFTRILSLAEIKNKSNRFEILINDSSKRVLINNDYKNKTSEYIGLLNIIMFSPEDLNLIKGNPKTRRRFLDIELGQSSKVYLQNLQKYNRLLKQRNEYLKKFNVDDYDENFLDILTEQLIDNALIIINMRERFLNKISQLIKNVYMNLTEKQEEVKIVYIKSISGSKEEMIQEFKRKYKNDLLSCRTSIGPQKDDIAFKINNLDAKSFGSQGQQRLIALALKLTLVEIIKEIKGEYPVMILDDVFSELDKDRQKSLIKFLDNKMQTFITTTEITEIYKEIKGISKIINLS